MHVKGGLITAYYFHFHPVLSEMYGKSIFKYDIM
jgi:hypothetical protein